MFKDKRKLEIIKNLRKELVILKPDKGNGIVLIGTNDYYTAIENLFSDKSKFNSKFNSFNKNLKFTVGTFENCVPHFLDIEIYPNGLGNIIKIPKLVNTQILNLLHCGNGKNRG